MKKLCCKLCNKTWIIEENDMEALTVCPFCAAALKGKVQFSDYDTLDKAIYGAIDRFGMDVLQNPQRLCAFMQDMAPTLKKEIRIFSKTVTDSYSTQIRSSFDMEITAAESAIRNLRHVFITDEGLSDNWADIICDGLYGAIRYTKGLGTELILQATISDFAAASDTEKPRSKSLLFSHAGDNTTSANTNTPKKQNAAVTPIHVPSIDELYKPVMEEAAAARMHDRQEAIRLYKEVAQNGYIPACLRLAELYINDYHLYPEAKVWYQRAAESGSPEAFYQLGIIYSMGYDGKADPKMAATNFKQAADLGYAKANTELGIIYEYGTAYPKDTKKAMRLYSLAAKNGDSEGLYRLGKIYQFGKDCEKSLLSAALLFDYAAKLKHAEAAKSRDSCINSMPPAMLSGYVKITQGPNFSVEHMVEQILTKSLK